MKSVRYFTLNYTGFTTAACEKQGYLRLIAGEHVFIPINAILKTPRFFDRLTINQPLHLGVRCLDNGCYWIHWLSDGETLLEPSQRVTRWARPLLIISLLTLIVALIPLVMSTSEWGRFGCGIIAILAFIGLLTGLYERLFHPVLKRHPRHARSADEDGAGPPPRLFLLPAATCNGAGRPPVGNAFLRKPCRNAMPSGREKLAILFLRSGSRGTQRGNTMALGYNATRRRWPSGGRQAAPISRCIPFSIVVSHRLSPLAIASSPCTSATAVRSTRYTMPATARLI